MARRRWLLGGLLLVGLVALAVPLPNGPGRPTEQQVAAPAQHQVLRPDQPYDAGGINEPTVLFWRGRWWMWYVGMPAGQSDERRIVTALATAPGTSDLTVAANWTKRGPVVGAPALEPSVIALPGGTLRMYSSTHAELRVLDSRDGLHWTRHGVALRSGVAGVSWWADCAVWQERSGLWRGLFEGGGQQGPWHIYQGHSRDGITFHIDGPAAGLVIGRGGMEGGPEVRRVQGLYHLWYHASRDGGDTVIDVYHATSPDGRVWTADPRPVVAHGTDYRIVDNPALAGGYLFWGGGPGHGGINVARA